MLSADPHNRTRRHHIKKLEGKPDGEGRYRLSLGRWRFRYDITGRLVELSTTAACAAKTRTHKSAPPGPPA